MKIKKEITNSVIYDENNEVESEVTVETSILYPEENYVLRNKLTNEIIDGFVGIGTEDSVDNYEEIPADEGV